MLAGKRTRDKVEASRLLNSEDSVSSASPCMKRVRRDEGVHTAPFHQEASSLALVPRTATSSLCHVLGTLDCMQQCTGHREVYHSSQAGKDEMGCLLNQDRAASSKRLRQAELIHNRLQHKVQALQERNGSPSHARLLA